MAATNGHMKLYCAEADMEAEVQWMAQQDIAKNKSRVYLAYNVRYVGANQSKNVSYDVRAHGIYEENTGEITTFPEIVKALDIYELPKGVWKNVYTQTVDNVEHDVNGNARITVTVMLWDRMKGAVNIYSQSATSGEYSNVVDLGTITRWAYITSATNFNENQNPTITYTNPAEATNLQACISFDGGTADIAYRSVGSGGSYTFNLTAQEREKLINAVKSGTSRNVRFYMRSVKDGVTFYKYVTRTFSLTDALPNLSPAVVDMNPLTQELTGDVNTLIKYGSIAAAQVNPVAKYGATIVSERITNGNNVEEDGLAAFRDVETNLFVFEAKDSRGNTSKEELEVPFIEYFKPTCSQKVDIEFDTDTETEAIVKLVITGSWFNQSFGAVDNEVLVEFRHRTKNQEWEEVEWISAAQVIWETTYPKENTYKVEGTVSKLAYDEEHIFQCRVTDKLFTTETSEYTVTLIPLFDWGENDFTFNVPVEINGNLNVTGTITVGGGDSVNGDGIVERGTEAMGSNGTWYWEKWSSGKAVCWGVRNYGNMAINKAWGSMYESASFSQDFPKGLFIEMPYFTINTVKAGGAVLIEQGWNADSPPTATNTGTFCCYRPTSMTVQQVYLGFYAIGRWK